MGNTFTKEGVVRLVPPRLDCRRGGPGVVPTGPVEHIWGLGMAGMCGSVSCHHSPRQIFPTFRQYSLYSRCQPLPIYAAPPSANSGILCFGPRHSFHPLTSGRICFRPSRVTHGSHPRLIHIGPHLSSLHIKRGGLTLWFLSFRKPWNVMENRDNGDSQWRQGATWRQ